MRVLLIAHVAGFSVAGAAACLLMLGYVLRARWISVLRRPLECVASTLPVFAVAGLPWLLTLPPLRAVWTTFLLLVPMASTETLILLSHRQDHASSARTTLRLRGVAAGALPLVGLTLAIWAMDAVTLPEPEVRSSVLGFYVLAGGACAALGIMAIITRIWGALGRLPDELHGAHGYTVGRVLLTTVCLWAYLSFAQFLLMWSGDMPFEAHWLGDRMTGPWALVLITLWAVRFVVPFLVLLSRGAKEVPALLVSMGLLLALAHVLDVIWLVAPSVDVSPLAATVTTLGISTVAAAVAWARFRNWPAIPLGDPLLTVS